MGKTEITSLYKEYFQKSRVFLYPALDIKRGVAITPIEMYMSWKGRYVPEDCKFCCLYHLRDDDEFKTFERLKLTGNKLFHDFIQLDDQRGVYVFDFSEMKDDWMHVLSGKYSKLSEYHKHKIRNFIGLTSGNLPYVDSFLYPERHFSIYAELIGVDEHLLRKVGELCSPPDLKKETLNISEVTLELDKEKV